MKYKLILLLTVLLLSCNAKEYEYKIEGRVKSIKYFYSNKDTIYSPAIAYTDTIYGKNEDSIWYYNSNGSKVTILAPYRVYRINKSK